jgi:hypothetical protein
MPMNPAAPVTRTGPDALADTIILSADRLETLGWRHFVQYNPDNAKDFSEIHA